MYMRVNHKRQFILLKHRYITKPTMYIESILRKRSARPQKGRKILHGSNR